MCTYFGTIGFIIILWTSICLQDGQAIRKPFEVVKKCPFNESEWKVRAAHTTCNGSDSYHCLLTEGGVILREQCTETSLFTKGFCPIFTNEGYLQWSPCKDTACPNTSYRSDEVFEYQICYQKHDNPKGESTEQGSNNNSCVTGGIIVAILFAFVLVSVLVVFYKRNQFEFTDVENSQPPEQTQLLIQQDVENGQPPEQAQPLIQQDIRTHSNHNIDTDGFQGIKLNPDCTVEKGIVITENITTALKNLKSRNVVILKGAIGCGKTHALKAIQNHFQKTDWETAWVEPENINGEISHEKPTIILCDNLFGKFGASVFSQDAVISIEKVLKQIDSSKSETKIVIGIHTHVFDEVKKNFKLNFLHQKSITVEMDNLSEAETLLIYKKQLAKGHCKEDPNCWFKNVGFQSVLDKLSKNQDHIGGPFLSLMYCNQHELFSDDSFSINPIRTLEQHIEKMKRYSTITFDCLVYLMCVQQHNLEEEPKMWAGHLSAEISKHNLMEVAKTSGLLHVDTKRATPAHELLTTVLFKSAIEKRLIVLPVLQMCDIDVFLQLLRPTASTHSDIYLEFTYTDSSQISRDAGKMCAYRLAQIYTKQEITHPLMNVEFVKKKCLEYLYREPKHLPFVRSLK